MKKRLICLVMLLTMVMLLLSAGCGIQNGGGDKGEQLRIASIMPSNTEILFALGLGEAVVGVTDFCNYPPELAEAVESGQIKRLGDSFNLNEELLVSLEPDLVLFGYPSDVEERLEELEIKSKVIAPKSLAETYASIREIGELTGSQSAAEKLAGDMEAAINAVKEKSAALPAGEKPRVLMLLDLDSLYVAGTGTLEDELINAAGGINVVTAAGYAQLSEEALIEADPEIILCTFPLKDRILSEKGSWKELAAVKDEAIHDLDGDLINRPGPRLSEGLELLYGIFHPQS
ncbi:MAG: ABC transporter substrate-binding protein [Firmicutes bacterium]|nr:ABC transporter substrate-binding protein [Bacillota bacterium]